MNKKQSIRFGRQDAMAAVPVKAPILKKERKDDKVYVTVEFERPRWQRALGAERVCQRTFGLDAYGQEVYEFCDGRKSVERNVRNFAKQHHISIPEAEISVTTFLKTLMKKGLVGMAVTETATAG